MATLPPRPNQDHLGRQARDLLRAARAGDDAATARIGAVSGRLIRAAPQLAVAREYGFASWARLAAEVQARTMDLGQQVLPVDARREDRGTALHAAAYSGSADVVTLLVDHGADIEARDLAWDRTPLDWAAVGSGERSRSNPARIGLPPSEPCSRPAPPPAVSRCPR